MNVCRDLRLLQLLIRHFEMENGITVECWRLYRHNFVFENNVIKRAVSQTNENRA